MRFPSSSRTWPGSNGSIIPVVCAMRRIHLSDLIIAGPLFDLARLDVAPALVQHETRHPVALARECQLRVDHLVEEFVVALREDLRFRLSRRLRERAIAVAANGDD